MCLKGTRIYSFWLCRRGGEGAGDLGDYGEGEGDGRGGEGSGIALRANLVSDCQISNAHISKTVKPIILVR